MKWKVEIYCLSSRACRRLGDWVCATSAKVDRCKYGVSGHRGIFEISRRGRHVNSCKQHVHNNAPIATRVLRLDSMPLRYQESIRLNSSRSAHSKEISCLSFSPKGKYLASAGIDGRICIWLVSNGRLLHVITGKQAVLSLQWTLLKGDSLLCGLLDGTVAFITITFVCIVVKLRDV